MVKRILETAQSSLKQEPLQKPFLHHWIPREESNHLVLVLIRSTTRISLKGIRVMFNQIILLILRSMILAICILALSSNRDVAKNHKKKTWAKKTSTSTGSAAEKRETLPHPRDKEILLNAKRRNFCSYCNISGHWEKKYWKLHP
jgi:hypothetical protein